ncbi:hypothetical protein H6P81_007389 [Aristolochia fimbriata]|uniref:Retrovirus-related Pol polyprotein from transposon TNT 1-94-like beta-barrel domain-containing protein n=1 Tax=Aristolochia fimbriata TaxID=158543 RepID=A0AAV7F036_ARIFI|nr:hypothetical protein H6P81_007389 [Aristolochia fimbriata]
MGSYLKGASNTRPPLLDGSNYSYWKAKMQIYIKAQDEKAWKTIEKGWCMPTKVIGEGIDMKIVEKPNTEWTEEEERLSNCNSKALNAIFGGVNEEQFRRISACTTTQEAWRILEVYYEGTESVRVSKLPMLTTQFELMRMREDESILEYEGKIRDIANQFAALGDKIPQNRLVRKVLRSLSSKFKMKRVAIEEYKVIDNMTLDELIGSLKTFEMNEKAEDSAEKGKKESIALQSISNEETLQWTDNRGPSVVTYECGGRGHIQSECPTYLKKKKSFVAAWSDDSSTSKDEECNHVAFTAGTLVNSELPVQRKIQGLSIVSDDETDDEDDIGTVQNIIKQWDGVLESTKVLREQVVVLEREKVVLKQKLDEKEEEVRETERKEEELRKANEIWVKFDKGKQQLDDILTQEKRRGSKHELGYSGASSSMQSVYTQPRHRQVRKFIPAYHFCGVYGHIRPYCYKLQKVRRRNENFKEGSTELLTNLQKENGGQVTFEDGAKGSVVGKGDLNVQGLPKLKNVLLVDGLKANLISISQLCDQNMYVKFTKDGCKVMDEENIFVLEGTRTCDNCYKLILSHQCQYTKENTAQLWHKRLGHIHSKGLLKLKEGTVSRVTNTPECATENTGVSSTEIQEKRY